MFAAIDQSVDPSHTFEFGETINVTSIMMGEIGAGLRELAGGSNAVTLLGTVPGVEEPVFLWEGPRTAQLSFVSALPLTEITAVCVVGDCHISITAVGY